MHSRTRSLWSAWSAWGQDTEWGETDARGRPLGNGCKIDRSTVSTGFPNLVFEEAAEMYHSGESKHAVFRAAYQAARELYIKIFVKGEEETHFNPATSVQHTEARILSVFADLGFLSESEVVRLFSASSKTLKLGKPTKLVIEDNTVLQGFPVGLRGAPAEELPSMRKIRVEFRVKNQIQETLMRPEHQIRKDQARELWALACDRQEAAAPAAVRPSARHSISTMEGLLAKAQEVEQASSRAGTASPRS